MTRISSAWTGVLFGMQLHEAAPSPVRPASP